MAKSVHHKGPAHSRRRVCAALRFTYCRQACLHPSSDQFKAASVQRQGKALLQVQSTEKGKSKPKGKGRKRKASAKGEDDGNRESTPEPMLAPADDCAAPSSNGHLNRASTPPHTTPPSDISSSNAYMLLYKKRDWQPKQCLPAAALPDRCVCSTTLQLCMLCA